MRTFRDRILDLIPSSMNTKLIPFSCEEIPGAEFKLITSQEELIFGIFNGGPSEIPFIDQYIIRYWSGYCWEYWAPLPLF